jgi:hypothetical protein
LLAARSWGRHDARLGGMLGSGVEMEKTGPLELFAALVDQLPLATREDLEWVVQTLRARPEWAARLQKARLQAREMGLVLTDVASGDPSAPNPDGRGSPQAPEPRLAVLSERVPKALH